MLKQTHFGALLLALTLPACATAIRGTQDAMEINTDPVGAQVVTTLETPKSKRARRKDAALQPVFYGCDATPCEFEMPRKADFLLTISKDGYEPVTIAVEGKLGKRGLHANLAQGTGAVTVGAIAGVGLATWAPLGTAGAGAGAGAAMAAMTAGMFLVPVGIDAMSGAMLNHNPNPISITLPPKGTEFAVDPTVAALKAKWARQDIRKVYKTCVRKTPERAVLCDKRYRAALKALKDETQSATATLDNDVNEADTPPVSTPVDISATLKG